MTVLASRASRSSVAAALAEGVAQRLPGLAVCGLVTLVAVGLQAVEARVFGHAWLESLVLAILVGAALRTAWTPSARWRPGIDWSAKVLLEVAVVLLGASVSAAMLLAAGPALLAGVAGVVAVTIVASYGVGRSLRLPHRMALLVACGNSICGNSAIAAVAPVIGAGGEDVSAAIAFTAVLGVACVLGLPLLGAALHMHALAYGAFAGLTVYAVPQVLAAAAPFGSTAVRFGTLVKLVRVLMLGPVCFGLSLLTRRLGDGAAPAGAPHERPRAGRPAAHSLAPWFILGFLAMVAARSLGAVPAAALAPIGGVASLLTVVSMAALGLGTDLRAVGRASGRAMAAAIGSLLTLALLSLGLIRVLHLG